MKNEKDQFPPDHAETFDAHGLDCALVHHRNPFTGDYYTGYVRIPPGHPWHGLHYDAIDADVHGGLTFSLDADDGGTWIGWDDAHLHRCERDPRDETEALAAQVAAAGQIAS
jgi:hypothetical protein